jgi:hypothetical protein
MTELSMSSVSQLTAALGEINVHQNTAGARMMLNLLPAEQLPTAIKNLMLLLDVARVEEAARAAEAEKAAVR